MGEQTLHQGSENFSGQWNGVDLIKTRRSVRQFKPDAVPVPLIQDILEAAVSAPSAHNTQPWKLVVLTNPDIKHQLAVAMAQIYQQDLSRQGISPKIVSARTDRSIAKIDVAPLGIVLCLDNSMIESNQHSEQEYWLAVQSVAVCGGYVLLAAHSQGLGGYWLCAPFFAQQAVRDVLDLPASWMPQALFLLGYSAQLPVSPKKKSLQEMVIYR
jgi:coenzyme F420-0:L-glutamate ligase/coenzyme F420-1:gamma-L-glutamate ligase